MNGFVAKFDHSQGKQIAILGALALAQLAAAVLILVLFEHDPMVRGIVQLALIAIISALSCFVLLRLNNKRLEADKAINELAVHDKLTGLTNRLSFQQHLNDRIEASSNGADTFALMLLNINRFKELNAFVGCQNADDLLQQFAQRLRAVTGHENDTARLNGDEFALIISYDGSGGDLEKRMQVVFDHLFEPYQAHGELIDLTFSAGVALFPDDGTHTEELTQNAQFALQRAREQGQDRVQCYDDVADPKVKDYHFLSHDMERALRDGEFQLYFQPQFSFKTGEQIGFEALMRWHHHERGVISPGDFIPIAEKNGFIIPLSEHALRQACQTAASWVNPLKVAVNLSPIQMQEIDITNLTSQILLETGLDPARLELEVTESLFINIDNALVTDLRALQKLGVSIALDDFGTGYSSLNYLSSFPFNKIKIDRSFVQHLAEDEGSMAIVSAVIGMSKSLNMHITAEGIEDHHSHELLRMAGCDEAQGFLLGKPRDLSVSPGIEMQKHILRPSQDVDLVSIRRKVAA